MLRKTVSAIMLTLLLTTMLTLAFNIKLVKAEPTTIIVPDDYPTIQEAINAANAGDTIHVKAGTYYENIVVNKTASLIGENRDTTIIDGRLKSGVVRVTANNVIVSGFTIKYGGSYPGGGISLQGSIRVNITNNKITDNMGPGILLNPSSSFNIIKCNLIINNEAQGIYLDASSGNIITNNVITGNSAGITLGYTSNNTLKDNEMVGNSENFFVLGSELSEFIHDVDSSNMVDGKPIYYWVDRHDAQVPLDAGYVALVNSSRIAVRNLNFTEKGTSGLLLVYSYECLIQNVTISNSTFHGIWLIESHNNTLTYNSITTVFASGLMLEKSTNNTINENNIIGMGNNWGIGLTGSYNNILQHNNIKNNRLGIFLQHSDENKFVGNNIFGNTETGIQMSYSSFNVIIHNNFIDNIQSVRSDYSINTWNCSYPSGGNYWSDHAGIDEKSGSAQNQTGSDGISDVPYIIDKYNQDNYPLMDMINVFNVGVWNDETYEVHVISNSTVSNFQLNVTHKMISFNVTGLDYTLGFCRVTIPNVIVQDLWQGSYVVLFNGEPWPFRNWTDPTNTYIYINYTHSEHEITIIPEFPSIIILPLFTLTTLIATVLLKKKRKSKPQFP